MRRLQNENKRQYKVIDQMLSMHSSLRDRLGRWALCLNIALMVASLFMVVFAFVGDDILQILGFKPPMTRFILGLISVVILVFSIIEFRVDWRSIAGKHAEAASQLADLKLEYRRTFAATKGASTKENEWLAERYGQTMGNLPAIPDKWFNSLKAEHRFKRLLSEQIGKCPEAPIWLVRIRLRIRGIRKILNR